MKLIIDIPEEVYKTAQKTNILEADVEMLAKTIKNGIPLDKIRAEIDRQEKWLLQAGYTPYNTDIAFDAIKAVLKGANE